MLKVGEVLDWIDARAPFDTQLDFDNAGLIVGGREREVTGILVALDCTPAVVREAKEAGCSLIVTHHPLMFAPIRCLREEVSEESLLMELCRENLSLIAAHTNFDLASGGTGDTLARLIGLKDLRQGADFLRVGCLAEQMPAGTFAAKLTETLGDAVRVMGDPDQMVQTVGIVTGAGGEYWEEAKTMGADAFLSGEIKHHQAIAAAAAGVVCFECGHHATEEPGIFALADALQADGLVVKSKVRVLKSRVGAYRQG